MSIGKMAVRNFRMNLRNYFSLIISLAFTVLILLNFLNIIFTDAFVSMGEQNKSQVNMVILVVSFVLGCFMFFFIWYSTNVFLTKRKKEIGVYVFMGLTNERIGRLYMVETLMTGITALLAGILSGTLTTQLFQMILGAISDIEVALTFEFAAEPVIITAVVFIFMYVIFAMKGYTNIVRSSVLDMLSASRQNEHVRTRAWILPGKKKLGIDSGTLGRVIANELRTAYACPFVLMTVSSYFSVHALEKLMTADLKLINVVSVVIIFVLFTLFYLLSVVLYRKNAWSE